MSYDELVLKIKDIAKKNDNKINITDIEKLCDTNSEEYFTLIEELDSYNIELIINISEEDNKKYDNKINRNDNTNIYLREIGDIKLLSKNEEIDLFKLMEKGKLALIKIEELNDNIDKDLYDELVLDVEKALDAKNKLVSANLRLSVSIAKNYVGRGVLFQDLIQAGNMGLLKASDKYDYKLGYSFSTYATFWIKQSILRSIVENSRTIRLPNHINDLLIKYNKAKTSLSAELGRNPSIEEISVKMNVEKIKVIELMDLLKSPESLDREIGDDKESILGEFIPDNDNKTPFEHSFYKKRKEEINNALEVLSDKEIDLIQKRFGLDGNEALTLEEIGHIYGISKEAVRQQLERAKRKLRNSKYGEVLKELWETLNNEEN